MRLWNIVAGIKLYNASHPPSGITKMSLLGQKQTFAMH